MATSPPSGTSGDEVGRRTFSTSFRGFDQAEVRAYLEVVAAEFVGLQQRITELEGELHDSARPLETAPLDAATLTSLVGEETARVLRAAQEAAEDLRNRAEEGAARTLTEAHEEAARIRSAAESVLAERTAEAETTAVHVRSEAQEIADKLNRDARAEADRTIRDAVEQGRDMLGQAQAARERVLADLARRRRSALAQVEQLRAGRERLVASLANVRAELDRITQDLAAADEVARQAAEAASRAADRKDRRAVDGAEGNGPLVAAEVGVDPGGEPAPAESAKPVALPSSAEAQSPEIHPSAPDPPESPPVESLPAEPASDLASDAASDPSGQPESVDPAPAAALLAPRAEPVPKPEPVPEPAPVARAEPGAEPEPVVAASVTADVTADALVAEEALISAPRKSAKRSKEPIPAPSVARPAYVHDPVPAAVLPGAAVGADVAVATEPAAKVDELFARIRADRAVATKDARVTLAAVADPVTATPDPSAGDAGLEAPRSDADETYLQRRDVLVEVVQSGTVRGLRRALADDQNAALYKFRTLKGDVVGVDALMGDEAGQRRVWAERAIPGLSDGAAAGAHLASGGAASAPDAGLVKPIAERVAAELVSGLRGRLAGVVESVGTDRGPDTVDRINSVFREWRSRIDRAVSDAVTEAVSAGFTASAPTGTPVTWVVEDLDGPCPDCDDNALAGVTPLGEPFPTGQTAPPAHPGCRCVLSRAST